MMFKNTQKLVYISLLTALQIVLARFAGIKTPIVAVSFSFLPLIMTAILFGAVPAMISAMIADVIGVFLFPVGPYFPGFTLSAALIGLVYGLLLYRKPRSFVRIGIACLIVNVLISLCLNTYWIYIISGKGFLTLLPPRIMQNIIMIPVKFVMTWTVIYRIIPLIQYKEVTTDRQTRKANLFSSMSLLKKKEQ